MTDTVPPDAPLRIALVVASNRPGRVADALLPWLLRRLGGLPWLDLDVVDLALAAPDGSLGGTRVADRVGAADGFVVLVPEYNHGYPGHLKTVVDTCYAEWARKPVTFVSYGAASGGVRAVEQLRQVFAELSAVTTRNAVALVAPWDHLRDGAFVATPTVEAALAATLDELRWWTATLAAGRAREEVAA